MSDEKRRDTREFGRMSSSPAPADDKQGGASRARNRTVLLSPEHIGQIRANMTTDGAPSSSAPAPDAVADLLPPVNWEYSEGKGGHNHGAGMETQRPRGQESAPSTRPRTTTQSFEQTEDGQFAPVSSRRGTGGGRSADSSRGTGGAGSRPAFSAGSGGAGGRPSRSNSGTFGMVGEEGRTENPRSTSPSEPFFGSQEEAPRPRAAAPLGDVASGARENFSRESAYRESAPQEHSSRGDTGSFESFGHGETRGSGRGDDFVGERESRDSRDLYDHGMSGERGGSAPSRPPESRPVEREVRSPEPRAPEHRVQETRAPEPRSSEPRHSEPRQVERAPELRSESRPVENGATASGIRIVCKGTKGKLLGFLVSFDADPNGEVVELRSGRWLVTSKHTDQGDYILIDDSTVSPLHAIIRATPDGQVQVLDQLSEYGSTLIRGATGEEEALAGALASVQNGDCVRFGNRQFAVCLLPRMKGR